MSSEGELEEEVSDLIAEYAEKHDVPEELLQEIYRIEQSKITMERREGLPSALRNTLEDYLSDDA